MGLAKPFRRTVRQFTDGSYANGGKAAYILDPRFATDPVHYVRAFLLLQKDFLDLLDYIEPTDQNKGCYSHRTFELLVRASVEVEANCKAILEENGYRPAGPYFNMKDYKKLDASHRLSAYRVKLPVWDGNMAIRQPFQAWAQGKGLPWFQEYNTTKHARQQQFPQATFEALTDAITGLVALLSAQFWTCDFLPHDTLLSVGGPGDGMATAIGGYFRVEFPNNWSPTEQYDFDWQKLKGSASPFDSYPYPP